MLEENEKLEKELLSAPHCGNDMMLHLSFL